MPSFITDASTTHHVQIFTTKKKKNIDQFLTTSVVISDTPAGYIFIEVCLQLD
jgi:hypothetical protein